MEKAWVTWWVALTGGLERGWQGCSHRPSSVSFLRQHLHAHMPRLPKVTRDRVCDGDSGPNPAARAGMFIAATSPPHQGGCAPYTIWAPRTRLQMYQQFKKKVMFSLLGGKNKATRTFPIHL